MIEKKILITGGGGFFPVGEGLGEGFKELPCIEVAESVGGEVAKARPGPVYVLEYPFAVRWRRDP